jgi:hypothetical protein
MDANDQSIWYASYDEEYDGLADIPTWDVITEEQYQKIKGRCKAIPSMSIAVIKYNEHNRPKCARYRIVVLGNLDLLTSLAVHHRRVLKNADVKQAFVMANLPEEDIYVVKPPLGCPQSKPGTYWKLIRSLYGLKRAPRRVLLLRVNHQYILVYMWTILSTSVSATKLKSYWKIP